MNGKWLALALSLGITCTAGAVEDDRPTTPAMLTQWGYVVEDDEHSKGAIDLPGWVHGFPGGGRLESGEVLLWSALYAHLPQMTTAPYSLSIEMGAVGGSAGNWYPYADPRHHRVRWENVLYGEQAEGPETTHPLWMIPRGVGQGVTNLMQRPGPPGTRPGDVGTTEGDVYLFIRSTAPGSVPLRAQAQPDGRVLVEPKNTVISLPEGCRWGWLVEAGTKPPSYGKLQLQSRRGVYHGVTGTGAGAGELQEKVTEALVGNGMIPDEASAAARMALADLAARKGKFLLFILPPHLVEKSFPLTVRGNAKVKHRLYLAATKVRT